MAPKTGKSSSYIDIYEFHFFMYNMTGYPYVEHDSALGKLSHALLHHTVCTILMFNICMSMYMVYKSVSHPEDIMYVLTMTGITLTCTLKICMMEYYKKNVQTLHKNLNESLEISELVGEESADEERRKTEEEFRFITKAFYSILPGAFAVFIILPVFFTDEKGIPYMFPVKNLETPFYEIIYIVYGIISILFMINTISYDMICYGFLLRLSTNYNIVSKGIKRFSEAYPLVNYSDSVPGYSDCAAEDGGEGLTICESTPFLTDLDMLGKREGIRADNPLLANKTAEFLRRVIRHHQELICQITLLDRIYNFNIFLQIVMGTALSCMAAAIMFSEHFNVLKDIRLSGFALGGFADLYLYCYCGSRCLQSEEDLRTELYSLPWYAMDSKARKLLTFMLTRLQSSKGITAGRMRNVSLDLFLGILKFSHSFIALLTEV